MNHSVRNKLFLLLIPFLILVILSSYLLISNQRKKMEDLYIHSINEKSKILDSLHTLESFDQVTVIYEEYGMWAEMAEFAENPQQEFISENLEWLNEGYGFSAVWVYDKEGKEVYSRITDSITTGILENQIPEFLDSLELITGYQFYKIHKNILIEFIATSIHRNFENYESGMSSGFMIVAKIYNEDKINLFESVLNGSISFVETDQLMKNSEDKPDFTKNYYDWNGKLSAILLFENNKTLYNTLNDSSTQLFVLFLIFTLFIYSLFALFVSKIISAPLNAISKTLIEKNEKLVFPLLKKNDEFGRIATIIKEFFENNIKLENEIFERKKAEESIKILNKELEEKVYNKTKEIQTLQDESPLLIIGFSKSGEIIEWNKNISEDLNNLLAEERNIRVIWSSLGLNEEELDEAIDKVIRTGEQHIDKLIHVNKEAAQLFNVSGDIYFRLKLYAVENEHSGVIKIVMTLEDRSEVEKAIRINDRMRDAKQKSEQVLQVQESERQRIARELHDGIGQMLMGINMKLESVTAKKNIDMGDLDGVKENIANIGLELNNIINDLHPEELSRYGLTRSLKSLCKDVENLLNIKIVFNYYDVPDNLNEKIQLTVYRIIQEALRNVQKHSKADLVSIDLLFRNKFLIITIEDNGIGFNVNQALSKGRGTKNLVSRVDFLNGICEIESSASQGTKLNIRIPCL